MGARMDWGRGEGWAVSVYYVAAVAGNTDPDDAPYHVLNEQGEGWGQGEPRLSVDSVMVFAKLLGDHDGHITGDAAANTAGLITPRCRERRQTLRPATL